MRRLRSLTAAALVLAAASAACGTDLAVPGVTTGLPRCADVPRIQADAALYRDRPIYVGNEMPADAVNAWAAGKPGFEALWIDRDHLGWVTVAFSREAAARQVELAAAFPGEGVVAVQVPWTMAELEQLQQRVMTDGRPIVQGSGIDVMHGVVTVFAGVLKPEVVRTLEAKFGGSRICIDGIDPANAPAEGPQQTAGIAWRLLADQDEVGGPYRTGIASDASMLAQLWNDIGLSAPLPTVDFQAEVVVWFGAVHGSSCPRLRLDDVRYDRERGVLHSVITSLDGGACTADAIGHAYVVAVQRSILPAGRFVIQLQAEAPPPGVLDTEPTIVDADLSAPGSTLGAGQVLRPTPAPESALRVRPGGVVEPDVAWQYRLDLSCGVAWLGKLNGVAWRAQGDAAPAVPAAWAAAAEADGTIDLTIMLTMEPDPVIEAVASGATLSYVPSAETLPPCP